MATVAELILLITGKDQTGKMLAGIKKDLNSFGSDARKAGTALTAGLTLPIVGVGTVAFKAAKDFESAFAGVRKTVDATEAEFGVLRQGIRDMSKEVPASTTAIARVAEAAGQLGISKENILAFTRTMIDLGETTNLTADEAATAMAQLANIIKLPQDQFDELGSALVDLGNKGASTESDILQMALRIAGAGHAVGLTADQILGFGAALANVGIEAEAGGSAVQNILINIAKTVDAGGKKLELFAKVAGVSAAEFKRAFKDDAGLAVATFIDGLSKIQAAGGSLFEVLDALEISDIRQVRAVLSLAGAQGELAKQFDISSTAVSENTALTEEARKRYETAAAKWDIFKNKLNDVAITIGDTLLPIFTRLLERAEPLIAMLDGAAQAFAGLDSKTKKWIVVGLAAVAALGPLLIMTGAMASGVAALIPLIGFLATSFLPLAAAGVIIYLLIRNWGDFARAVTNATSVISRAVSGLVSVFNAALSAVLRVVTAVAKAIYTALQWLNPFASHSPPLVDQVRDGVAEIAENFKRLEEVERSLATASESVRAFEASMANLSDSMRAAALAETISDINRAAGSEAANAYRQASAALAELTRAYTEMGAAIVASAQKFDPAIQSVDDLRDKIAGLKNAISDLSRTPLLEEKPFDAKSKAIQKAMDELQLKIVKLKQKGPLTMEIRTPTAGGGVKTETKDTSIGLQVKALEKQLEALGLKAQQIDIEKRLAIDPLKDKLEELTGEAPKPFAAILAGILEAQAALKDLSPLEEQAAAYDDLGERIDAQSRILQGYADMASEVVRQQEAMASAAEGAAGSIDEIVASLSELGTVNPAIAEMDERMGEVSASILEINQRAEEFKAKAEEMIQKARALKARFEELVGPIDKLKWLLIGAAAGFVAIQTAALAMSIAIGVVKGLTAAVIVLNAVMALNPIFLVVAAVVALIAILIILEVKFGLVSAAVDRLSGAFQKVLDFAKDHWPEIATLISGPFAPLVLLATDAFGIRSAMTGALGEILGKVWGWGTNLKNFFTSLPGTLKDALGDGFDFIWDAFKGAINKMISAWNGLSFSIPSVDTHIPKIGKIGGFTLNTPDIPLLKSGLDYVPFDNFPALLHKGERVVPANENNLGAGGINFNGPITVVNNGNQRDARGTLSDVAFAMAAELRSRGRMLTA